MNSKKFVILVNREAGSGGKEIASMVAKDLGIQTSK